MDRHYQIFISSTYIDLKDERKAIIEAVLNSKNFPAGMESFSASNDEQFKYIKKIIDNCDYYILIIANRYGSINPVTGISFTEQEFDYAIEKEIPVLVFIKNDISHDDCDNIECLVRFKDKVSNNRLCKFWNNQSDLVSSVIISLLEEISDNPQPGWTRGGFYDNSELLTQLNELRIKNERLIEENAKLVNDLEELQSISGTIAFGEDLLEITGYKTTYSGRAGYNRQSHTHDLVREMSWNQIFSLIGPYLFCYISFQKFSNELKSVILKHFNYDFSSVDDKCVQVIKIQLNSLNLIEISPQKSTSGGVLEFIRLTQKGKKYLAELVTIKKEP